MKTFSLIFLLLVLCSCGGSSSNGDNGRTENSKPPIETRDPAIGAEARKLETLWLELHNDSASTFYQMENGQMTRFRKGIEFGRLIVNMHLEMSDLKAALVCEAFILASETQSTPDYTDLAKKIIKGKIK